MNTEELAKVARAATPGPWLTSNRAVYALTKDGVNRFYAHVQDAHTHSSELRATAAHIAAWSPERALAVLAVVEAAKDAVPVLVSLDTLRHLDPRYPELDNLRAALKALEAV